MSSYLPRETSIPNNPSDEDLKYAQAFDLLAGILEGSGQREKLTLFLSTCRNAFLTVNALFVDLRLTLGHGKKPSLLSQAIYFLRERQINKSTNCLHEASLPLSEFKRKRSLWGEREKWIDLLDKTIETCRPMDRDRIRRILYAVRTSDLDRAQHWDKKFYALSTDEPASITESLQILDGTFTVLDAVVEVCMAIAGLLEETNLFEATATSRLERVFDVLCAKASVLGVASVHDEAGFASSLAWNTATGQARWIRNSLRDVPDAALAEAILDLLEGRLAEQYQRLTSFFQPNVGIPPLPPPFCIDLTAQERGTREGSTPEIEVLSFGLERPGKVRIALPWVGVPLAYYNTETMRLLDSKRTEVEHAARGLLMAAVEEKAQGLILPEYFMPRTIATELCKLASEAGIVLVAGMEGQTVGQNSHMRNEALVQLPSRNCLIQSKISPSVYERPLETTGKIKLFNGTSLGTFGVIICSDLLDWHVVHALAGIGTTLDLLFVCACNPSIALFEHLAAADAHRFYCHVLIVNNCMDSDQTKATGNGTLVSSPKNPPILRFDALIGRKDVPTPPIGGCQPQIAFVELSVQGLAMDRIKPADGLAAFPPWRNKY